MHEEAGTLLNAEAVKRFLQIQPPFPVGIDVIFAAGKLKSFRGIVKEVKPHHRSRPVVRALRDPKGQSTKYIELELWKHPDFEIASQLN